MVQSNLLPGNVVVSGTLGVAGLITASAGITGTGNTGTLTAGTGILGTANSWSALQTFGNNISIGGATVNVASLVSGNVLQYNGTNWVNVPMSAGGFVPTAGTNGVFWVYFNGTNYATVNMNTGTTTATYATGAAALQAVVNLGATTINLSPEFNSGTTAVTFNTSHVTILGNAHSGEAATTLSAAPACIQVAQLATTVAVSDIVFAGVTFGTIQFGLSTANFEAQNITFDNCAIIADGSAQGSGIVFDGTFGGTNPQYIHFTGLTSIFDKNVTTSSAPYPGQWLLFKNTTVGMAHVIFEDMEVLEAGASGTSQLGIRFTDTGTTGFTANQIIISNLDINNNNDAAYNVHTIDATSDGTNMTGSVYITHLRTEFHGTSVQCYLWQIGLRSGAGNLQTIFYVGTWELSKGQSAIMSVLNNLNVGATLWGGNGSTGLYVGYVSNVGTASLLTTGTWAENANFPVYLGYYSAHHQTSASLNLCTGGIIVDPLTGTAAGSILSCGGTVASASWVSGNNYVCGGTPLQVYVSGGSGVTISLTSAETSGGAGTALLTTVAVVADGYYLTPGMTITLTWTTAPTITVVKAA